LEAIFASPPHPELPRQLFILTDGQVTNDEAVIALVRKHSSNTRVFSFGIGAGASHHLVQGIARAGNGAAELIYPNERIEGKVMRQLGRALSPALSDVKIDWGNLEIRQAPHHLPPVFADGRVLVYGFVDKAIRRKSARIELTAKGPQGDLSFEVTADFSKKQQTNMIATLAARTLIRDLEEGASALHDRRGSLRKQPKKDDRVKQEAVRLGAQYGLCSQWTSFVAVEHRESPVDGELQLRKVPVALTRDWGGLGSAVGGPAYALPSAPPPMQPSRSYLVSDAELACSPPQSYSGDEDFGLVDGSAGDFGLDSGAPDLKLPRESSRPLDRLVALQHADGSWSLTPDLAEILGLPLEEIEAQLQAAGGEGEEATRAWATALAIAWLESEAADSEVEWILLAAKAKRWLERCQTSPAKDQDWIEAASNLLVSSGC
ncbi:MAG: hypothetical protein WBG49_14605, partial [Thermoanaerobaculia bacterium]